MKVKIMNIISRGICAVLCAAAITVGLFDAAIPERVTLRADDTTRLSYLFDDTAVATIQSSGIYTAKADVKLASIPIKSVDLTVIDNLTLIPGGVPFGVKLYGEGVCVVGISDVPCSKELKSPARDAGMCENDVILEINGQKVSEAAVVADIINKSCGKEIILTIKRGESVLSLGVTPVLSDTDGKYRAGITVREGAAGIGTVTYINPDDGSFAGLGHGICENGTNKLAALTRGAVVNVTISGVQKGQSGAPGELKGYFSSGKIGTLFNNTECGVYGIFAEYPRGIGTEAVEVGIPEELCEGDAEILCTTDGGPVQKYSVKISDIDHSGKRVKNFVVTVTDPALIERTGGIVQGMSGSPIIQNGKLVGAVTHVLIGDPLKGYGIFITNMLSQTA